MDAPQGYKFESLSLDQNGTSALAIAKRLGYISVIDVLKLITEETVTMVSEVWSRVSGHPDCPMTVRVFQTDRQIKNVFRTFSDHDRETPDEFPRDGR